MQENWKNVRQAAEEGRYEDIPEDVRFLQCNTKLSSTIDIVWWVRKGAFPRYAWWLPAVQIVKLD